MDQEEANVKTTLTERDLEDLPEPTRSAAFEILWLLREGGYSEDLALRLALRGAHEAQANAPPGGSIESAVGTTVRRRSS
jgi:hypothetical protein